MIKVRVVDVVGMLNGECEVKGDQNASFIEVKPIEEATKDSLIWIAPEKNEKEKIACETSAKVVLCDRSLLEKSLLEEKTYIFVSNPRLIFCRILSAFFSPQKLKGIAQSSNIHSEANIGRNCFISLSTIIGQCLIGDNCQIMGNVTLYDNITVGNNCIIHSGTVIGVDGFGVVENEYGGYEKIEHISDVHIGDNVEIFANVSIARGNLASTKIGDGVKINNNVHIAHNVVIEENTIIAANVTVCGSVYIGAKSWIGPSSVIRDGVTVGRDSTLGMGAVLAKDMTRNRVWMGNPAREK